MTLFEKISFFFKRKEESFNIVDTDINILRLEFKDSQYLEEGCLSEFPTIVSLINQKINAAYTLILINDRSYRNLIDCLINEFNIDIEDLKLGKVEKIIVDNYKFFLKIEKNFNGYIFSLITDNKELLSKLIYLKLQPPPPWIATNLEPKNFLFPQGKEEYYWNTFWLRFYGTANSQDLTQYLSQYQVPLEWQNYFEN